MSKHILSIDFGERRVGLALADTEVKIPQPFKTVSRENIWEELDKLFSQYEIKTVVVGLPLRTDGTEGKGAILAKEFANELSSKFSVQVRLWDERFTTKSAEQTLRMLGKRPSRNKKEIDKLSALIILEEYLESDGS